MEAVQSSVTGEEVSKITKLLTNISTSFTKSYLEKSMDNLHLVDAAYLLFDFIEDSLKSSTLMDTKK